MIKHVQPLILAFVFLSLLITARLLGAYGYNSAGTETSFRPMGANYIRVISGPLPTIASDFQVLNTSSVYYAMESENKKEYSTFMALYLKNANLLDPYFRDVYRLSSSLLAFDAALPLASVEILERGCDFLPSNWEIPFFGGIIAHQLLGDDARAYRLMRKVADRPDAPLAAINLAARFLSNSSTNEDAIQFLKGLLQSVPEDYREGIKKKIVELKADNK